MPPIFVCQRATGLTGKELTCSHSWRKRADGRDKLRRLPGRMRGAVRGHGNRGIGMLDREVKRPAVSSRVIRERHCHPKSHLRVILANLRKHIYSYHLRDPHSYTSTLTRRASIMLNCRARGILNLYVPPDPFSWYASAF